ncbi:Transcription termination factor mitochondrial/chloroplastic [Arabidopsis suecica]|uniref:Transcription termination factor mitochondrial/chloroplastic n=1 Tax=Arabidopsis suecica TaxID=45249 RepID=A0A8T2BKJ7_ARASU|nr:Transcription termination factor mitochondrial/chloroplastic [Arabidopsis suecica]
MYSLILHGRRLVELQKWRHLRFALKNVSPLSNSFSSASAAADVRSRDGRKGKNFTVSYLVDSLGFTTKLAESISRKVNFTDKANPDSVLTLLRSHGFIDSQISCIITDYPELLILDAEKSLGRKLQILQSRGVSSSELTEIVSTVPRILGRKSITVYYDAVKDIIVADKSSSYELPQGSQGNKIRNVSVLRELGMPQWLLLPLLVSKSQPVCGKENFDASLKKVVEMGFDPTTSKFVVALRMLYQMSEKTIEEKVVVYTSVGFTLDDVWEIFKKTPTVLKVSKKKILKSAETFLGLGYSRAEFLMMVKRYPPCIEYSLESVKRKNEFLVKKMNWPLNALVLHPQVFGYSMEKRIIPRCNVLKVLLSKGLLRKKSELPAVSSVLSCTDEGFLNRYVMKHNELAPTLMAIFTKGRVS